MLKFKGQAFHLDSKIWSYKVGLNSFKAITAGSKTDMTSSEKALLHPFAILAITPYF